MIDFEKMLFEEDIKQLETLQDTILSADEEYKAELLQKIEEAKGKLIKHQRIELKRMKQEAAKTQKELEEKMIAQIAKLNELKEKCKNKEQQNSIEEKIKNYEITLSNIPEKIQEVLKKHENIMFNQLEKVGITTEELRIEPNKKLAIEDDRGIPTVNINVNTGKYILRDTTGKIYEKDIEESLLKKNTQKKFAEYLLKKHILKIIDDKAENVAFEKELENYILTKGKDKKERKELKKEYIQNNKEKLVKEALGDYKKYKKKFNLIAEYADINLYTLYVKYDRENGTNFAQKYIQAIDIENNIVMPTKLEYYVGKDKIDKKEKIPQKIKKQLLLIATNHEEINIGAVTGRRKNKLWEKITKVLGIARKQTLALSTAKQDIEKVDETREYKKEIKVDVNKISKYNAIRVKKAQKENQKETEENQL